jgi:flagellar biogenesis protein FliO
LLGEVAAAATLPFTGLSLALIAVIGLIMILIGFCIRLAARQRRGIGRQS